MAKKKRTTKKRKVSKKSKKETYNLPTGFWSQISAILLLALAVLLVIAWFGAGGPILNWIYEILLKAVGYTTYILPALFGFVAIEVFRSEDNQLPKAIKFASLITILLFSGLFGLLEDGKGNATGGIFGSFINKGMLALVNNAVATFIYILLIIVTLLFTLRISPASLFKKLTQLSRKDADEFNNNKKVIQEAAGVSGLKSDIAINAGVPTIDKDEPKAKLSPRLSTFKDSITSDKAAEEQAAFVTVSDPNWKPPSLDILEKKQSPADVGDIKQNAAIIRDTLREFDINAEMEGANIGPKVTQYTLRPPSGVKLTKITALENNISLNLAAQSLRIEAPIPGKKAVGIEVPNIKPADVRLYSILKSKPWNEASEPLTFAVGKDISGEPVVGELNKMPHMLIAGQTGAGKSVMINTLLASLLYRNSPSELRLILVDPKQVEMAIYEGIPHLLTPIIVETDKTISALKWAVNEMQRRYSLLAEHKVKDIRSYNNKIKAEGKKITVNDDGGNPQEHDNGSMPYIVIVIDELADIMMVAARDVEALIARLAQKARAVGIHLVLATQSPRVDIITGLIKANVPARIAFTVSQQVESRIILDQVGAEKLLGQGDMLYLTTSMSRPKRIQGALVTDKEIGKITDHLRMQAPPQYNEEVVAQPVQLNGRGGVVMDFNGSDEDDLFNDAARVVIDNGKASATLLQRRLRIGYARAARIMESLEDKGIVGPQDGSRPREVLVSSLDDLSGDSNQPDEL